MRGRSAAIVILLTITLAFTGHGGADAYWHDNCGDLTHMGWAFNSDSRWTSDLKSAVNAASGSWTSVIGPYGKQTLTRTTSQGPQFILAWADLGTSTWADTLCVGLIGNGHQIRFNTQLRDLYVADPARINGVATHEFGHAWGVNHSQFDPNDLTGRSVSGSWLNRPSMATCVPQTYMHDAVNLSQDDIAAVEYIADAVGIGSQTYRGVGANTSFEQGRGWWGTVNGAVMTLVSSGGINGPRYVRFPRTDTTYPGLLMTTRYTPMDDVVGDGFPRLRARTNVFRSSNSTGGNVRLELWWRAVNYHDTTNSCGAFGRPRNSNGTYENQNSVDVANLGPWMSVTQTCSVPTSWAVCTMPEQVPPSADAIDVRVFAYNYLIGLPGSARELSIDGTRVLVDDVNRNLGS